MESPYKSKYGVFYYSKVIVSLKAEYENPSKTMIYIVHVHYILTVNNDDHFTLQILISCLFTDKQHINYVYTEHVHAFKYM